MDAGGIGGANVAMRARLIATIALFLLADCSEKLRWNDTTGQGRPEAVQDGDLRVCKAHSGWTDTEKPPEDWETTWAAIKACMAAKGWTPITRENSN